MDAGPALDAELAQRVLGKTVSLCDGTSHSGGESCGEYGHVVTYTVEGIGRSWWAHMPPYSTAISSAWLVVERMRDAGWVGIVTRDNGVGHYAEFWRLLDTGIIDSHRSENESSCPLAICLAALDAIADKQGA